MAVSAEHGLCAVVSLESIEVHSTKDGSWQHAIDNRVNSSVSFKVICSRHSCLGYYNITVFTPQGNAEAKK